MLPKGSIWTKKWMHEFHVTPMEGHSGAFHTLKKISDSFYWPGMKSDVYLFVAECMECQRHKYLATSPAGLLQPLLVPDAVWEELSMDLSPVYLSQKVLTL